jgi:hypothetical protein
MLTGRGDALAGGVLARTENIPVGALDRAACRHGRWGTGARAGPPVRTAIDLGLEAVRGGRSRPGIADS